MFESSTSSDPSSLDSLLTMTDAGMWLVLVIVVAVLIAVAMTVRVMRISETRRLQGLINQFADQSDSQCDTSPGRDDLDLLTRMITSAFDRQRAIQRDLRSQQERLEIVIDSARLCYWDWDLETNVYHVNGLWEEMLGYVPDTIADTMTRWSELIHSSDLDAVRKNILCHLDTGQTYLMEFRMRHPAGHWVWLQASGAVLSLNPRTGKPKQITGTLRDISAVKQTEEDIRRSENRLKLSQRIARMGSWHWNPETKKGWWSEYMYDLYGMMPQQHAPSPQDLEPFIHPADRDHVYLCLERLEKGVACEFECQINDARGVDRHLYTYAIPRRADSGESGGIDAIVMDISDRKKSEERNRLAQEVFDNASDGLMVTDARASIVAVNPAFSALSGYEESELIGRNPAMMRSHQHDQFFFRELWRQLEAEGVWRGEIWNCRKNGEEFPSWMSIKAVLDQDGELVNYVASYSDLSNIKNSERQLHYLSQHDALTDLPNRLLFSVHLDAALKQALRHAEELAVLFLDLDNFKHVNDGLGHTIGDEVLQLLGQRLKGVVGGDEALARLGGDEFAVMLTEGATRQRVAELANKLLKLVSAPLEVAGHQLSVGGSIGISIYPGDGESAMELMKNADAALHQAKESGRNTYQFFSADMTREVFERVLLESNLRHALEEEQLVVYYQPQIDLNDGRVIGAEALLRWRHPHMGMISPVRFIPLAEESGLIVPIGEWVLQEACRQVVAWREDGFQLEHVAVNFSAVQLIQPGIVDRVRSVLEKTACRGEWLELEVTESCIMRGADDIISVLEAFRQMGISLAIDDFGTGYSSLSYLKRLPINNLKVDKSFVDGIPDGEDDVAISRAIVALGKSLRLTLVAEGIETGAQQSFLQSLGCERGQGYLFSQPVTPAQFNEYLRTHNVNLLI